MDIISIWNKKKNEGKKKISPEILCAEQKRKKGEKIVLVAIVIIVTHYISWSEQFYTFR